MIGVDESNYKLRLEQVEAISKLIRFAQVSNIFEITADNDPLGELIQELAQDIARYAARSSTLDQVA